MIMKYYIISLKTIFTGYQGFLFCLFTRRFFFFLVDYKSAYCDRYGRN